MLGPRAQPLGAWAGPVPGVWGVVQAGTEGTQRCSSSRGCLPAHSLASLGGPELSWVEGQAGQTQPHAPGRGHLMLPLFSLGDSLAGLLTLGDEPWWVSSILWGVS